MRDRVRSRDDRIRAPVDTARRTGKNSPSRLGASDRSRGAGYTPRQSMERPTPTALPETEPFWQGCRDGVLLLQRCCACGSLQSYPRAVCTACLSSDLGWRRASGLGRIHSFTTVHRALSPAFEDDLPYVVAVIELEEGLRMVSRIVECDSELLAIEQPVEVAFERVGDECVLPVFRPAPVRDPRD